MLNSVHKEKSFINHEIAQVEKKIPGPGDYNCNSSTLVKNGPFFLKVFLNSVKFC